MATRKPQQIAEETTPFDLVRVRHPETRHQYTVLRAAAVEQGLEIIDKPATDRNGNPLPPITYRALNEEAPAEPPTPTDPNHALEGATA